MERFFWLGILVAIIWAVQVANLISGYALSDWFGLIPRATAGLDGILLMPLVHGSLSHAAANTAPLVVLGALLTLTAPRLVLQASTIIVLLGGLGVWLFGSSAIHVGASGLIFGWFGFLVTRGMIERRPLPLLVAIAVVFLYGTMIWGILPGQPGVSWEAHFFGAGAGIFAGFILRSHA
jgi:membrane associated rhomboid family serine protease